jgi:quinol monooxygenase YgiN
MIPDKNREDSGTGKTASIHQWRHTSEEPMILATIKVSIPPQKRGEALRVLESVAGLCRDSPGCVRCNIYRDLHDKKAFVFEEVWRAQEDLELHLRSEEYRNLLLVLEMALKQPEIRFDTVSGSTGLETIEKARGCLR